MGYKEKWSFFINQLSKILIFLNGKEIRHRRLLIIDVSTSPNYQIVENVLLYSRIVYKSTTL